MDLPRDQEREELGHAKDARACSDEPDRFPLVVRKLIPPNDRDDCQHGIRQEVKPLHPDDCYLVGQFRLSLSILKLLRNCQSIIIPETGTMYERAGRDGGA